MSHTVNFKTLNQESFTLELQDEWTIAQVKEKVAEARGANFAADLQKMIYNGKVLDNEATVKSITFDPSKYVVVMCARPKEAAPPPAAPAPVEKAAPAVAPAPADVGSAQNPAVPVAEEAPEPLNAEQQGQLEAIIAMGYPRDQALAALRAAFFNGDRAVEFLLNGIPDDALIDQDFIGQAEAEGGAQNAQENEDDPMGDISALRDLPQLEEIRSMIQQNPEMLGAVLQQIAAVNPRLVQAIQNNQEAFINMLNNPRGGNAAGAGAGAGGAAGGNREGGPRRHVIHLAPEEMDAINRIKAIVSNVPEAVVVEAYFACDKNEEAALNFIFNSMDE